MLLPSNDLQILEDVKQIHSLRASSRNQKNYPGSRERPAFVQWMRSKDVDPCYDINPRNHSDGRLLVRRWDTFRPVFEGRKSVFEGIADPLTSDGKLFME